MTRALVFAADSFLGRHVVTALRAAGMRVREASRRGGRGLDTCDITDSAATSALVRDARADVIVQCAAATHTAEPREMVAVHCFGTINVLAAIQEHSPIASTILIGTAAEYGEVDPADLPISETQPAMPTSYFGASKAAQIELARAAAYAGIAVTVVRPFNIIGAGLPEHYAPARIAERVRELTSNSDAQRTIEVLNAAATRDFVDVRDVAAAIRLVAEQPSRPGTFSEFNVATGLETSIHELAQHICDLGSGCRVVDAGTALSRSGIDRSCGDATRIRSVLGWTPRYSWQESVREMWNAGEKAASKPTTKHVAKVE